VLNTYEQAQIKFLCSSCNSVSQFSNTAICAAVDISFVVFCVKCHCGRLKFVTSEGRGKQAGIREQLERAACDNRHSKRTPSVCSALLSYVIRSVSYLYNHFGLLRAQIGGYRQFCMKDTCKE
jgi:hypothetical protein